MGGGALMTPALIFLGVGDASAVVTADLTAAAVYKSAGAIVHWREGSPNLQLAGWLIIGSVPFAFLGPFLVRRIAPGRRHRHDAEAADRPRAAARRLDVRRAALHPAEAGGAVTRTPRSPRPGDPADPDDAGRRRRRSARRHHVGRLRLGDHDRPADALSDPDRGEAGRHRPGAGGSAGVLGRRLQHHRATGSSGAS